MEVTIVMVLASLVMLALLGFYINSQATWTDASSQALAQRELTAVVERLSGRVHEAASAVVVGQQLSLFDLGGGALYSLTWNPADSLLYDHDPSRPGPDVAITSFPVTRFQVVPSDSLVTLVALELRTAAGKFVSTTSTMALINHPVNP
jgi:hypothetical protein